MLLHASKSSSGSIIVLAEMWMFKDLKKHFAKSYGLELFGDLDYQAALVQSNPHHKVCTPDSPPQLRVYEVQELNFAPYT